MNLLRFRRSGPPGGRPTFLAVLLAVVVVLALGLLWQRAERPAPEKDKAVKMVDVEAWGVQLRQRNADGEEWSLRADHAAHLVERSVTRLSAVRLQVTRREGPPLTARAARGCVTDDRKELTLEGDVVVEEPRGYRLTTDSLTYFSGPREAVTSDPVWITADFGEATGLGARLWAAEDRVKLDEMVTTTFRKVPHDAS